MLGFRFIWFVFREALWGMSTTWFLISSVWALLFFALVQRVNAPEGLPTELDLAIVLLIGFGPMFTGPLVWRVARFAVNLLRVE